MCQPKRPSICRAFNTLRLVINLEQHIIHNGFPLAVVILLGFILDALLRRRVFGGIRFCLLLRKIALIFSRCLFLSCCIFFRCRFFSRCLFICCCLCCRCRFFSRCLFLSCCLFCRCRFFSRCLFRSCYLFCRCRFFSRCLFQSVTRRESITFKTICLDFSFNDFSHSEMAKSTLAISCLVWGKWR